MNQTQERANRHCANAGSARGGALRELACVGRSLRDAGVSLRCGNCLVAGRKAPVCTQRSRSIQAAFAAIGTRRRQPDTGTSVSSPPSRMRRILAPAPKGMRALSAGHVAPFHHGVFLLAHPFRELAYPRYVTMISAHRRLTFFVFFALLQLREMIRRNVIVPLPGNSWEGKLIARRKLRCSICGCWAGPACEERELLFL